MSARARIAEARALVEAEIQALEDSPKRQFPELFDALLSARAELDAALTMLARGVA